MPIDLTPVTRYMREVLFVLKETNLEEDGDWLFRFKTHEVAAWSDQKENRPPDVVWARAESGPRGKIYFRVRNGIGTISSFTFTDDGE